MLKKRAIEKRINKFDKVNINTATNNKGGLTPYLLMVPAFILIFLFIILPLIILTKNSFVDWGEETNPFYKVWHDPLWWQSVRFSFLYSFMTLSASLTLSLFVSSILASFTRKAARSVWQTLFFIPYVTSIVAMSIVFSAIFDSTGGIFNKLFGITKPWLYTSPGEGNLTLITIWIFGIWQSMAFQILILVTAMLAIDKRLYDAADIDGISKTKQFFNITFPQLKSVINYLILIGLINSLKTFTMAIYQNDAGAALDYAPTMLLYIYYYSKEMPKFKELAGAASILMIIFVISFQLLIVYTIKLIGFASKIISNFINESKIRKFEENSIVHNLNDRINRKGGRDG